VACICASYGYKCVFLGASLPLENLASVAQTVEASSLCVSISSFASEEETLKMLLELRQLLPLSAELWIGGSGAPDMIPNTKTFGSLTAFEGVLS